MLELRLLGQFEVRLNGTPVSIPSRAGQSLLAYLALSAGTAHRRERLAGLLWPDASEANARRNLRQALWRVREALGRDYILSDDLTIAFDAASDYSLDAARLQAEAESEALALYQGDLLPGFYDEWVVPERERLRAHYERGLQTWLERLANERRWPDCLTWAERWIALGGAPEPAYRALMAAHAGLGDPSAVAATYQRCVEALQRELGVEPSPVTARLFDELRASAGQAAPLARPPEAAQAPRHNLPLQLTSFIGREREVAEVRRLLGGPADAPDLGPAAQSRLLTLTGPAGTGKTRLALEAATGLVSLYTDGVWLVELAPVADPALVWQVVAAALGVREDPSRSLEESLHDYLRDKTLLILVDNCEHLIDACATLAETLLQANPGLRILATSRESLGISGETAFRVPSLSFPGPRRGLSPTELARYDAIRLFVERARAVQPDFRLTDKTGAAVSQLVARLDGIPLAIELAAARLKALSVEQVAERLNDRFRLLTGGSRTALPRQQTLRALIDWSYDLLSEDERRLLRRLSVFAGGFTLEAAERVADDRGNAGEALADNLDLLMRLVDKSLVISEKSEPSGERRYRLLETIRQYALERLLEAGGGEAAAARGRHLAYFLQLAEEAEPHLRGHEQMAWLDRLELEHDNLRAALEWSLGAAEPEEGAAPAERAALAGLWLAGSLWRFWYLRSSRTEGRNWLERALGEPPATAPVELAARDPDLARARAEALVGIGWLANDIHREQAAYEESLALFRAVGDRWGEAFALRGLGASEFDDGDRERARPLLTESLQLFRELGDPWGEALALFNLAWLLPKAGIEVESSSGLWQRSLALFRQVGDRWGIAVTMAALSSNARMHGEYDRAAALSQDSLGLFRELGDRAGMASSLNHLALVAYRRGDFAEARELLEKVVTLNQETGNMFGVAWATDILGLVACYQGDYERSAAWLDQSVSLYQAMNDPGSLNLPMAFQGLLAYYQCREAEAEQFWEKSLELSRSLGDKWNMGMPLNGLGLIALGRGQSARAGELLEESLAVSREASEKRNESLALGHLGRLAREVKDFEAARALHGQSLQMRRTLGAKRGIAETFEELGRLAAVQNAPGDPGRAAQLFGAAEALRDRIGAPLPPVEREEHERLSAATRERLGEAEFDRWQSVGRALSLEAAMAYALGEAEDSSD